MRLKTRDSTFPVAVILTADWFHIVPVFIGNVSKPIEVSAVVSTSVVNRMVRFWRNAGKGKNGWSMMLKLTFCLVNANEKPVSPNVVLSTRRDPVSWRSFIVMEILIGPLLSLMMMCPWPSMEVSKATV